MDLMMDLAKGKRCEEGEVDPLDLVMEEGPGVAEMARGPGEADIDGAYRLILASRPSVMSRL